MLQTISFEFTHLPIINSSLCEAEGLILVHISSVNTDPALLNTDVKDEIMADIITAIIKPLRPVKPKHLVINNSD